MLLPYLSSTSARALRCDAVDVCVQVLNQDQSAASEFETFDFPTAYDLVKHGAGYAYSPGSFVNAKGEGGGTLSLIHKFSLSLLFRLPENRIL
jgi:hypothetical protein